MNDRNDLRPKGSGMAGGAFIALGLIAGLVIGAVYRQPSLGMVIGLGTGTLAALLIWLLGRR